jgi:phospholipid/cholesterol/gamma-HCH transport system substrate-binding protein
MKKEQYVGLGIFVVVGLLLFTAGIFLIGNRRLLFEQSFELWTEYSTITGLQNGATVRVSGKDAGEVLDIDVPPDPSKKFRVKMRITEELHPLVRTDSVASIQTDGLVGNKFLSVSSGTKDKPIAPAGSTISGQEAFEFTDLMAQASNTMQEVNETIEGLQDDVERTLKLTGDTIAEVQVLIKDTGGDIKGITSSSNKIANNINEMLTDVKQGKGTIGKLVTDDTLYENAESIAKNVEATSRNLREAAEKANQTIADFREKTQKGLGDQASGTLRNLNEVLSDMAENTEALKRNWFFRGFYKNRGYYDIDNLTIADYLIMKKDHYEKRLWLSAQELFEKSGDKEVLTEKGKDLIRANVKELFQYIENNPIYIIEGYDSKGNAGDQYLVSRSRALAVRTFVEAEFPVPQESLGILPIGLKVNQDTSEAWDGVALVVLYEEAKKKK